MIVAELWTGTDFFIAEPPRTTEKTLLDAETWFVRGRTPELTGMDLFIPVGLKIPLTEMLSSCASVALANDRPAITNVPDVLFDSFDLNIDVPGWILRSGIASPITLTFNPSVFTDTDLSTWLPD